MAVSNPPSLTSIISEFGTNGSPTNLYAYRRGGGITDSFTQIGYGTPQSPLSISQFAGLSAVSYWYTKNSTTAWGAGSSRVYKDSEGSIYYSADNQIHKLTRSGDKVWSVQTNVTTAQIATASAIAVNSSGYVAKIDQSGNDILVTKLDKNANLIWQKNINGGGVDYAESIAIDEAGNVYICGEQFISVQRAYVAKLNSADGSRAWETTVFYLGPNYCCDIVTDGTYVYACGGIAYNGSGTGARFGFIAKWRADTGEYVVGNTLGDQYYDTIAYSLDIDQNGYVYCWMLPRSRTSPYQGRGVLTKWSPILEVEAQKVFYNTNTSAFDEVYGLSMRYNTADNCLYVGTGKPSYFSSGSLPNRLLKFNSICNLLNNTSLTTSGIVGIYTGKINVGIGPQGTLLAGVLGWSYISTPFGTYSSQTNPKLVQIPTDGSKTGTYDVLTISNLNDIQVYDTGYATGVYFGYVYETVSSITDSYIGITVLANSYTKVTI